MNPADLAASMGWTHLGEDANGNPQFGIVDDGGDKLTFSTDWNGNYDSTTLRNETQETRDAEAQAEAARVTGLAAEAAQLSQQNAAQAVNEIVAEMVRAIEQAGTTAAQLAHEPEAPGEPEPPRFDEDPPAEDPPQTGGEFDAPQFADLPTEILNKHLENTGSGKSSGVDTPGAPSQTTGFPASRPAMTLQDFAASNLDLANNWANATNPAFADDPNAAAILSYGSFDEYLRAAAQAQGVTISAYYAPVLSAQQFAAEHGDLLNNWRNAFDPAYANDPNAPAIRSYGSFNAYLQAAADGLGVAISGSVAEPYIAPVSSGGGGGGGGSSSGGGGGSSGGGTTGGGNGGGGGGGGGFQVSPLFDPTHRFIAQTAAGALYMLIDEGGDIITWFAGREGQSSNAGRATMSAAQTAAALAQQFRPVNSGGGGGGGGGSGGVNIPPGGVSPLFDPVHRFQGYTREGYEVYRLTDEGGRLVEWYDIPGRGAQGKKYLTGPNDPATYVYSTSRPSGGGGGGGGGSVVTVAKKTNWAPIALVGFAGLGAWYLARRNK